MKKKNKKKLKSKLGKYWLSKNLYFKVKKINQKINACMVKITIVEKREFDFIGKNGEKIEGKSYSGFLVDGKVLTFTSTKDYEPSSALGFDESRAIEIDIVPKIWGGMVKYRENQPELYKKSKDRGF